MVEKSTATPKAWSVSAHFFVILFKTLTQNCLFTPWLGGTYPNMVISLTSKKTRPCSCICYLDIRPFFGLRDAAVFNCMDSHFVSGSYGQNQVSSQMYTVYKKKLYIFQYPPPFQNKLALFRTSDLQSNFGAHFSHSFFMFILVKIFLVLFLSTFKTSDKIPKYTVRCVLKIVTNLSTFSSVFIITGRTLRLLHYTFSLPSENLLCQTYEVR
jgi:hypothetical protein